MTQGIYAIINSTHGGAYFGSSNDIESRWKGHIWDLNKSVHHNRGLQSAWHKYGSDCFYFDIVEIVEREEDLLEREQRWIEIGYYNIAPIAGKIPSRKGIPLDDVKPGWTDALKATFTEERRKNLSELRKANPEWHANWVKVTNDPEVRARAIAASNEAKKSDSFKKKISEFSKAHPEYVAKATTAAAIANKGKHHSEERKRNISAGLLAYHALRRSLKKEDLEGD